MICSLFLDDQNPRSNKNKFQKPQHLRESPRVNVLSPKVNVISPEVNAISPEVKVISPKVNVIAPKVNVKYF